uniref:Uncharacterized protein n=1 Tax=Inoviridae sp. ctTUL13 TaxID=2825782 RepID=A0A8S5UQ45_9VIRU|nr:MAG TPA: hypothetical protein [Inoviridae sp. ctTUL13]
MQSAARSVGARVPAPPRITGSQGEPNFYELASKNVGFAPPAKTLRAVCVMWGALSPFTSGRALRGRE